MIDDVLQRVETGMATSGDAARIRHYIMRLQVRLDRTVQELMTEKRLVGVLSDRLEATSGTKVQIVKVESKVDGSG